MLLTKTSSGRRMTVALTLSSRTPSTSPCRHYISWHVMSTAAVEQIAAVLSDQVATCTTSALLFVRYSFTAVLGFVVTC